MNIVDRTGSQYRDERWRCKCDSWPRPECGVRRIRIKSVKATKTVKRGVLQSGKGKGIRLLPRRNAPMSPLLADSCLEVPAKNSGNRRRPCSEFPVAIQLGREPSRLRARIGSREVSSPNRNLGSDPSSDMHRACWPTSSMGLARRSTWPPNNQVEQPARQATNLRMQIW